MPTPAESSSKPRPVCRRVGVIGAGRAGSSLASALARAGYPVVATTAGSAVSRQRAARMLPGVPIRRPDQVVASADLILLTVRDDALAPLVGELADANVPLEGRILVHASGRHGIAVLEPASSRGALPLALHPVMTFTGRPDDVDRMAGISFGVTVRDDLKPLAETLVHDLGGEPVFIDEADRELYHAALASGANHLVTLVAQAAELLAATGVPDPARLLRPILSAALENALQFGDLGLTGPVVRADADTITGHMHALKSASPQALPAYVAMSRLTADRAHAAGLLGTPDARRLLAVLEGVLP